MPVIPSAIPLPPLNPVQYNRMDHSHNECQCGLENPIPQELNRIIGGKITKPNQYPWQVQFMMKWNPGEKCTTPKGQLCLRGRHQFLNAIASHKY